VGFCVAAKATVGAAETLCHRETFFAANPELRGQVVVHHAVEQQVLKRYPGVFSREELSSRGASRGIPVEDNPATHLSAIRRSWNGFYKTNPSATREDILNHATRVDRQFGGGFRPPR